MEFTVEAYFKASPQQVYETWLDSEGHSEMTGGEAEITDDIGDPFNTWDGYIWGKNLELKTNEYIKQSWMTSDFAEGQDYSIVEIYLKENDGGCHLTLKHSQLTEEDQHYIKGWEDHYFVPMKGYFT
jgi:activator of HSP90 ATPase